MNSGELVACMGCGAALSVTDSRHSFNQMAKALWADKARQLSPRCQNCTDALLMPATAEGRQLFERLLRDTSS
jgi:hypothetical protein